jgi:hypothetical protein
MGPTRIRDLVGATVLTGIAAYLLVHVLYRWFPPITLWSGVSLLGVAIAEAGWGYYIRMKINDGEIGVGRGWLDPLGLRVGRCAGPGVVVGCGLLRAAAPVDFAGGRRGHRGFARGGGLRAGADRGRAVAAALLQVARRTAGERQRGNGIEIFGARVWNRRSARHAE